MLCALAGLGCQHTPALQSPCETPPPFLVTFNVSDRVNPDPRGRAMPVLVQVLQLKDSARLERARFRDLWGRAEEVLQDDLVRVNEFTLAPGQSSSHWLQRDPKARYVLTMGHFRQPLGYSWRTISRLEPVRLDQCKEQPAADRLEPFPGDTQLRFRLQGYQIDPLLTQARSLPAQSPEPSLDSKRST